ncbi:MAG TPA: hypothetical protein VF950_11565 [Planctomycetota bacterium]
MTSSTAERPLFGSLVLCKGLCTLDELDVALDVQRECDPPVRLGEVLVDMGKLTPEQVKTLLELQGVTPAVARLVQESGPPLFPETRTLPSGERFKIGDVVLRVEGMTFEIVPVPAISASTAATAVIAAPPTSASTTALPAVVPPAAVEPPAENKSGLIFAKAHAAVAKILPFLHPHRTYALLAALPGLLALVLPWRLFTNGVWSYGVQGPGWITFLLTSSAGGLLLLGDRPRAISRAEKTGVLALSGLALLLSLWKLFSAPNGATAMGIGIPLALISAALLQLVVWPMKAVEGDPLRSPLSRLKLALGELTGKRAKERTEKVTRRDLLLKQAGEAALTSSAETDPEPVKTARKAVDAPGKPIPGKRERAILRLGRAAVDAGVADKGLAEEVKALDQTLAK